MMSSELLARDVSGSTAMEIGHPRLNSSFELSSGSLIKLRVEGMRCSNCAKGVESALMCVADVKRVTVQVVTGSVEVETSAWRSEILETRVAEISGILTRKNYAVEVLGVLPVSSGDIEPALCHLDVVIPKNGNFSIAGVKSIIRVGRAHVYRVAYDPYVIGARKLLTQIPDASLASVSRSKTGLVGVVYLIDLALAIFLTIFLHSPGIPGLALQYAAALVAYAVCGRRFLIGAAQEIFSGNGNLGMDVLVSVGMSGALAGGFVTSDEDERMEFFAMTALLVAVVLVGKFLEDFAKRRATRFMGILGDQWENDTHQVQLETAKDEREMFVPQRLLEIGDRIRARPGEKFPCDGRVEWSSGEEVGAIESLITGEEHVVKKAVQTEVLAGSLLVGGSVVVKVTRVGELTVIKQIERLAEKAQNTRFDHQNVVDKVSAIFVPLVLVIAISTYIVWRLLAHNSNKEALNYALAVLMVSCPCALGLAAPTAIVMATSVAAKTLGAIVKGVSVLENLAQTRVLVFDKTGTITLGRPLVTDTEREFPATLWSAIAALEAASEHPVGKAIFEYACARGDTRQNKIADFKSEAAVGVQGVFAGRTVQIRGDADTPWLEKQRTQGRVAVGVFVDGNYEGGISLRDPPRADARRVVQMLKNRKIQVVMCTGDSAVTAKAVAKEVGIDEIKAKCTPKDKQRILEEIKTNKKFVVMIGDGINDAPALAAAFVGIAMGSGVRIASESADVVLVRTETLANIVGLIDLSDATLRCIKRNLLWAFGFNSVMIPWAAGVFHPLGMAKIPPALAGVAMAGSSLLVVLSSLLLGRFRAPASDCE